jgi:hypothetical protein
LIDKHRHGWITRAKRVLLAGVLVSVTAAAASNAPTGVFLWYPEQAAEPSSSDCDALVKRVKPSVEKAEAWYWGRAPFGSELEFYLFITEDRMEPTFSAEGDYDFGRLSLSPTMDDETSFELVPDDHPAVVIAGSIVASKESSVVTVILRDVPANGGKADRTTYYCRFGEEAET